MMRCILVVLLLVGFSDIVRAQDVTLHKSNYLVLKTGVSFLGDDFKDLGLDWGFYSEFVYGHYFTQNLALEGGVGYCHDGDSEHGMRSAMHCLPIILTAKGVLPLDKVELYAGAGGALYLTRLEHEVFGQKLADDRESILGGHLVLGANFDISRRFLVGLEGKYIFTQKGDFDGIRANMNEFVALLNLGMRF